MTALNLWPRRRLGLSPRGGGRRPTSPSQLAGLEFWYDAADSPVVETAGAIERWDDLSGNANHAGQASAGARPVKTLDAAGRNVIRFDGSDDSLDVTTPPSFASGVTLFLVFRMRQRSDFTGIVSAAAAAGTDHVDFFTLQNASAAGGRFQLFGRSTEGDTLLWQPTDDGGLSYVIFALGGGSGAFRALDGAAGDTYDGSFGTPDDIVLGARFDSGVFGHSHVDLLEVGLYSRKLGGSQISGLEDYLLAKYPFEGGLMAEIDPTAAGFDLSDYPEYDLSRPSASWAWNETSGLLESFSSGAPALIEGQGILLQPQRTNLNPRSYDVTSWIHVSGMTSALNAVGIDGSANKATTCTDPGGSGSLGRIVCGTSVSTTYTSTWWVKKKTSGTNVVKCVTTNPLVSINLNPRTGASALASNSTAPVAWGVVDMGDWWLVYETSVATATSRDQRVYPAGFSDTEPLTSIVTNAATGNCILGHAQMEAGSIYTAPIVTNGATVTRLADILTLPAPGVAPGAIGLRIGFELVTSPAGLTTNLRLFGSDDATGTTEEIRTLGATAWAWTPEAGAKGGTLEIDVADLAAQTHHTLGLSLTDSEQVAVLDGNTELDDSQSLGLAHSDTEFQLGSWNGAMPQSGMWLRHFSYWIRSVGRARIE